MEIGESNDFVFSFGRSTSQGAGGGTGGSGGTGSSNMFEEEEDDLYN